VSILYTKYSCLRLLVDDPPQCYRFWRVWRRQKFRGQYASRLRRCRHLQQSDQLHAHERLLLCQNPWILILLARYCRFERGDQGRVPKNEAIVQLFTLIKRLEDGVSLLVFVMRGRIKESTISNWRLFQEVICKSQVRTVIVITGLEGEDDMDDWWFNNKEAFRGYGIRPDGHACITATRGRRRPSGVFTLQEEYDESKHKVERLIRSTFLQSPWKMDTITWFTKILTTEVVLFRLFFWKLWTTTRKIGEIRGAVNDLVDRCGMSRGDAEALAKLLEAAN